MLNDPNSSYLALALSYVSFALIIVTTFSLILESMPAFSYTPAACGVVELTVELCRPEPDVAFGLIELTGPLADLRTSSSLGAGNGSGIIHSQ